MGLSHTEISGPVRPPSRHAKYVHALDYSPCGLVADGFHRERNGHGQLQ